MTRNLPYSRPLAASARLGDLAEDRHRFIDKRVLLTGEQQVVATRNGRDAMTASLCLLVRICRDVSVFVPPDSFGLLEELRAVAKQIEFDRPVQFLTERPDADAYNAVLNVGTRPGSTGSWTMINSDGWLARVSSGLELPPGSAQFNPVGSLAAACMGVAEVFKRLLALKTVRGPLLDATAFSLYSYKVGEVDPGPKLPETLRAAFAMIGAGAIGNGIIFLLKRLSVTGEILIVDKDRFGDENLGTCLLVGPSDIGKEKARFAAQLLSPKLRAVPFSEDLASFSGRLGKELPYPDLFLAGLDNIDARHELQNLWPGLILDGAIGDFGCQVSRHPWGPDIACLMCLFRHPPLQRAEQLASRATGLSETRAQEPFACVTREDVLAAPLPKQDWLEKRVGRPICSVIQEGIAQQLSESAVRPGFEPSTPFVAGLSASMVVGEFLKALCNWPTPLEPRFQFDILRGPAFGQALPQQRRVDCVCTTRVRNIERWRVAREQVPTPASPAVASES